MRLFCDYCYLGNTFIKGVKVVGWKLTDGLNMCYLMTSDKQRHCRWILMDATKV